MKQSIFTDVETFTKAFRNRLKKTFLKDLKDSTIRERFKILGTLVREEIALDWTKTKEKREKRDPRTVYYVSMEFLMGRLLTNNLMNMGVRGLVQEAFEAMGIDFNEVEDHEQDPGLGNGGLGRLAACYLDSMASLGMAGHGSCIRYRYGLFRQKIKNGYQEERPDNWLSDGYVWEIRREEEACDIPFDGHVEYEDGKMVYHPAQIIRAVPYDVPIVGDKNHVVNHLRLWNAEPADQYPDNKSAFEYEKEMQRISGFLYPDDTTDEGKRLRLTQQYFLSASTVRSVLRKHKALHKTLNNLHEKVVFHINDTHPTLVIPELMRILLDEEDMEWEEAWKITSKAVAYTNHTILAEALEKWPVHIFQPLLPRIYQLIEEINRRFTSRLLRDYGYEKMNLIEKLAIVHGGRIRMAHLCIVAGFSVNGVARLHTDILKNIEMNDFYNLYPDKFHNVTNGITHRRWLLHSNPELTGILEDTIGDSFKSHPQDLKKFLAYKDDKDVQKRIAAMKKTKKQALADHIYEEQGIRLDTESIFDIQVKRMHEYKRQLMNALHIMSVYHRLKNDKEFRDHYVPHSFIFGAKAAATYYFAKKIIKLINTIADKVNHDEDTNDYLKVVFVENYNVSYAEIIMPAADISEQISTASKEASGTGNMKFMMNGAVTLGTEDGANVEIHELVGDGHIFIFGMDAGEVNKTTAEGKYRAKQIYERDPELHMLLDELVNGFFGTVNREEFREIFDTLVYHDQYYVLKDFKAYKDAHESANEAYKDKTSWWETSIVNIARSGVFSSDRSIRDYATKIWDVPVRE